MLTKAIWVNKKWADFWQMYIVHHIKLKIKQNRSLDFNPELIYNVFSPKKQVSFWENLKIHQNAEEIREEMYLCILGLKQWNLNSFEFKFDDTRLS